MKRLFIFDLDGTLAESKSALSQEMASLLRDLLSVMKVAVISGGAWAQFETQLLGGLSNDCAFANLFLLPTCGTQFYEHHNGWTKVYSEDLTAAERALIITSLDEAFTKSGNKVSRVWGDVIEDRGSQITLSALGQQAPLAEKETWDPNFTKRAAIIALLKPVLPGFSIRMGGTTSIDVTKSGIDKAYGIGKLRERLNIPLPDMLFAGDALFPGGNDFPAQEAGVDSLLVRDPQETARCIQAVLACVGDGATQIISPRTASA